ncbi:MAG: POTRA domain-containing protein [Thermoanaerobaculia bacterium]
MRAVEIHSDAPIDRRELEQAIAIEVGAPLDETRVRRTLRGLRFSGLASETAVYTRPQEEGVVVVVAIWAATQVESVDVSGELGLKAERLRAAIPFGAGQPLLEDRVLRGLYALKDLYRDEGFLSATVRLDVESDEAARTARIRYLVDSGPRSRIGAVTFEGAQGRFTDAELLGELRAGPGNPYRSRAIEANVDRLADYLIAKGYRTARVERLPVDDAAGESVAIGYGIELGPRLELAIDGAEQKELEKKGLLPFLGEGGYDDALVLQSVEKIRRHFQEKGHYRVEVERQEERTPDLLRLTITVRPGERYVLEEVSFEGNESFPPERLAKLMSASPRRLLLPRSGRLVDAELGADLSNLRSFYALEGFDHAHVGPAEIRENGSALAVIVPIVEGRQRLVEDLVLEGLAPLDERELRRELPIEPGGPFHRLRVEQCVDLIRARLERVGFGSAIVASNVSWDAAETGATVTLSAIPGPRELVSSVLLRGLDRTRPEVLRRFLPLHADDPLSRAALLGVQQRLYSLGVFSRVDVRAPTASEIGDGREVLVEVTEGKARAVSFGLGYDSENGPRGLLRLSHGNLFGRISSLTLDLLLSERERHTRLIFRQPYFFRWDSEFQGTVYDEHEERPSFVVDRRGMQVALHRTIQPWTASLFASYRIVELDAGEFNADIPLDSRNARVASVTPGLGIDYSDDPIDPKRGWNALAQLEYAFPFADADARFLKLFGQASVFVPLGRGTVFAASVRGGAIEPLATAPPGMDELAVSAPAAELFYAGGRTSHRAYERDALGIVGRRSSSTIREPLRIRFRPAAAGCS